ncbi:hypothetical protein [Arthrobacter sp. H5]|uniref:hypothetical protein n=1 Tax=Arthrobacter sp. H5 TaxID=1267973 RepID=UPI00048974B0|nr:hypothetical protein [Arthrobacter sp. H5]
MFFRPLVAAIPGTEPIIGQINSMGTASILWYTIPAILTLVGLRRHHWSALLVLAATLAAVGITMYNGTALSIHLNTIFAAGTAIAAVLFLLTVPPWQEHRHAKLSHAAH